jgi:hypothetical protein
MATRVQEAMERSSLPTRFMVTLAVATATFMWWKGGLKAVLLPFSTLKALLTPGGLATQAKVLAGVYTMGWFRWLGAAVATLVYYLQWVLTLWMAYETYNVTARRSKSTATSS